MESVYLDNTIFSYLVSQPSRDMLVAVHQQITRDWWAKERMKFRCCISQFVLDEAADGDPDEAKKRLDKTTGLTLLEITASTRLLIRSIIAEDVISAKSVVDAGHISVATVNGMDYILTWNCAHMANAQIIRRLSLHVEKLGYRLPLICTPEGLLGGR